MFDVNIQFENLYVSSIESEDIVPVEQWLNMQQSSSSYYEKPVDFEEFYNRFLEYYASENEFFLKINNKSKLLGVFKGRIEFKKPAEVWIWYFMIDKKFRNAGLGSRILKDIMNYFDYSYGFNYFYIGLPENQSSLIRFWKKNNYEVIRISKSFYNIDNKDIDLVILSNKYMHKGL